jgi:hypothetical protein
LTADRIDVNYLEKWPCWAFGIFSSIMLFVRTLMQYMDPEMPKKAQNRFGL